MESLFSSCFHPLTAKWFSETFGSPTDIQVKAWERIAGGDHLLVSAPTGSGKTLAAFLWPLDRLVSGAWEGSGTRVLYVSPLKALNTDIRENLLTPLKGISAAFRGSGTDHRQVSVSLRSGDTGQPERRRLLVHPPDILITTPESLNILLSTLNGKALLGNLRLVILDEIHGIVDGKRGTHLITAVERLALLSGEFQRVGISATMNPMEEIARFMGGYRLEGGPDGSVRRERPVTIVDSPGGKRYDIGVITALPEYGAADWDAGTPAAGGAAPDGTALPPEARAGTLLGRERENAPPAGEPAAGLTRPNAGSAPPPLTVKEGYWSEVARTCVGIIGKNRSTLFFANSRRMAEKVTRLINDAAGETLAYSHHGSLSRELRATVERRFREGSLRAIVATSSLEMGIDIGSLDEVVLIQAPPTVASGLQRAGRAGHGVGEVSRVRILPLHGMDLVVSGVMASAMGRGEIERIRIPREPLDVLAQVILSMTLTESWNRDDLYDFIRCAAPYENLSRQGFDSVLGMLAGRYEGSRVRELSARVFLDPETGMISAKPGAASLLYLSGGTIPDRGYYAIRMGEGGARMGELDEEFVWERKEGDRFAMGNRSWKIQRITDREVEVVPVSGGAAMAPFWRGDVQGRYWSVSERIGGFMEEMDRRLEAGSGAGGGGGADSGGPSTGGAGGTETGAPFSAAIEYASGFFLDREGAWKLVDFLHRQKRALGCGLPSRRRIVGEWIERPDEGDDSIQLVIHTLWGGRVNRPLSMILVQALEEKEGIVCEYFSDDNAILLLLPERIPFASVFALLDGTDIPGLLRKRLEETGVFGARFRENAGRALLLPRKSFSARMPLWITRQKSKRLFRAVARYPDFPVTAETWRTCLYDEFDIDRLRALLEEIGAGAIEFAETFSDVPSPMAQGIVYQKINDLMYRGDDQKGAVSSLTEDILDELAAPGQDRPRIPRAVAAEFEGKKRRTAPGYVPEDERELLELVTDRLFIPLREWEELTAAIQAACAGSDRVVRDNSDRIAGTGAQSGGRSGSGETETEAPPSRISPWLAARVVSVRFSPDGEPLITAAETCSRFGLEGEPFNDGPTRHAGPRPLEAAPRASGGPDQGGGRSVPERGRPAALRLDPEECAGLLSEWLRFYGPVRTDSARETLGLSAEDWAQATSLLLERGEIVTGLLTEDAAGTEICDLENFKILLRMNRRKHRPAWEPLPFSEYQRFLLRYHGLGEWAAGKGMSGQPAKDSQSGAAAAAAPTAAPTTPPAAAALAGAPVQGLEEMKDALGRLWGFPAPAGLWERDIFASRFSAYDPAWLDSLVRDQGLLWFGCGTARIAFSLEFDYPLFAPLLEGSADSQKTARLVSVIFPGEGPGRFPFWDLQARSGIDSAGFSAALWKLAWDGRVTNDRFETVRKGIRNRFAPVKGSAGTGSAVSGHDSGGSAASFASSPKASAGSAEATVTAMADGEAGSAGTSGRPRRRSFSGRSGFGRWMAERPVEGMWRLLPQDQADGDPLEREEEMKETARVLLARYGVVFRELLEHELPGLGWSAVFRSLRLMEFSGEVVSGPFFAEIPGIQFALPGTVTLLEAEPSAGNERVCWMNACDPASLAGLPAGLTPKDYPPRVPGNHMVFAGGTLVLVSRGGGKRLEFLVPPGDAGIPRYLGLFGSMLKRRIDPLTSVRVEEINGEPASGSPYKPDLLAAGFREGYRGLTLYAG